MRFRDYLEALKKYENRDDINQAAEKLREMNKDFDFKKCMKRRPVNINELKPCRVRDIVNRIIQGEK